MYVGLDVHKDFCQASFVDSTGKVVKEKIFENSLSGLEDLVKATRKSKVVLEASSSSMRVYDALCKTCEVKVAHPSKVKAIASARIKTDKIDARMLAQLLRADLIPESYMPSEGHRQARLLVRHRASLVRLRTRIKNQVQSLLTKEGIKVPFSDAFGRKGLLLLRTIEIGEIQRFSLDSMLAALDTFNARIREFDKRIESFASQDAYAKLLVTMPGVSWFSALVISSEICDINRFESYKKLCSYSGLVPSVYQSGNTNRKGHITKQGSGMLRWVLVQDARVAVKHSRRFRRKYKKLEKRIGDKKAIVAIARNMCISMYFMLVRNETYKESEGGKPVRFTGH
jgi:transposase